MTVSEIMSKYTAGELSVEEANKALFDAGSSVKLDPDKNAITTDEYMATSAGDTPDKVNGWGLLDTGTGSLDKVEIRNGRLVDCDCGEMYALVFIAGRMYHISGSALTE